MHNNHIALYDELLALDNKLKIHQRHLQFRANEICKSKNKLNPSFMRKTYKEKNISYLTEKRYFPLHSKRKHLNFRGSVLCNNLPIKLIECKSLQGFKLLFKQSENLPYTC